MLFDTHTIEPASSRALAEFVSGPPWMRSSMSSAVAQSELRTRSETSTIEDVRSNLERREIATGSATINATSRIPSTVGSSQFGPGRSCSGRRYVSTIAAATAATIGHRASATA
jgi:hypothetical protein